MKSFLLFLLIGVLSFIFFVAYSSRNPGSSMIPVFESKSVCRVIKHSMGETCVPIHPQRIVTLSLATLGNVLALGIQPIGATNEYERENYSTSFQGQAEGIKIIGRSRPNLESTLLLRPDLIVGLDWNSAVYPLLSQIAPTVMGELHYSEWRKYFHFVAEALGAQKAEKVAWEHYYQRIEELKTKLGDRYQNSTISFICFYDSGFLGVADYRYESRAATPGTSFVIKQFHTPIQRRQVVFIVHLQHF
ncbi:ABC transporter substrate-binding protein [bacterium]|nr:ABC transporter substrate-binding protein [bacterium]